MWKSQSEKIPRKAFFDKVRVKNGPFSLEKESWPLEDQLSFSTREIQLEEQGIEMTNNWTCITRWMVQR